MRLLSVVAAATSLAADTARADVVVPGAPGAVAVAPGGLTTLLAIIALAAVVLWLAHRLRRARRRLDIHLAVIDAKAGTPAETQGSELFGCWSTRDRTLLATNLERRLNEMPESPTALVPLVAAAEREELAMSLADLVQTGRDFELNCDSADGAGAFRVRGRRLKLRGGDSVDIVWLRDRSRIAEMQAQLQEELASVIRQRDDLLCVLDLLPFPLWERNADLSLRYVNAAYARAVEMAPEDVLSRQVELGASAISDKGKSLARMARDVDRLQAESHHIVIGEERRLIEFSEMPVPNDPDGGRLLGIALDQTDLEGVQSQLSQHIAAHAEVFEQLSTAIVIYGPDKRISYFNDAYRTLSYLDRKFLQSAPTYEEEFEALREKRRLPEVADFVAYKKARLGMFRSLIGRHEELVYLPDGQTLRLVVTPHPFGGLMFAYEDVTDRLALESSYNTLNAVQRATLDNLYEGVAVFGSDGRLKLYNPVYARMWLLSDDDLQGDPHIAEIVDNSRGFFGDGMEWEEARRREIARVTDPRPHTGRMERADNSVLDYAVVPLPDGNVLLSYLDVTDSVRVEQALLDRNEALETADRLKSEFVANVSYELRTPLNTIMGFAEILNNQYFGELNRRQAEYSRGLLESSQQLMALINDILDLATIEAGHMILDLDEAVVDEILANVVTLSKERAREHGLEIKASSSDQAGTVVCDDRRIRQALFNVVSNAIKFTPPDGRIEITARRSDQDMVFVVSDTGIGIPADEQTRVFEKFERGSQYIRRPTGAGLGLALVRKLVELHDGRVELFSEQGKGTTVTIYLPLRPPAAATDVAGFAAGSLAVGANTDAAGR